MLYLYIYVYIYICVAIIIKGKRTSLREKMKGRYRRGERGKGKEKSDVLTF